MSLAFLENYKMMIENNHPNVSPLIVMWSLCIEEHFYIIWGFLLYFTKTSKLHLIIASSITISIIFRWIYYKYALSDIDLLTNLGYFSFGALPAYLLIERKESVFKCINKLGGTLKMSMVILVIIYLLMNPHWDYKFKYIFDFLITGSLFSALICLTLDETKTVRISNSSILSKLGVYTYGLYLIHTIIINLFNQVFRKLELGLNVPVNAIVFICLSFSCSLLIAILSYNLFERQFLKLKKFFY